MANCGNCGSTLERRRCLSCAAEAAKAQPHVKSPLGFRLVGAGLSGVLLAGLLVLGVASTSKASPKDILTQATEATKQAGTATFVVRGSVKTSGSFASSKNLKISGSGIADFATNQSFVKIRIPGGSNLEEVKDNATIYLRTSPNGKWTSVDMRRVSGLSDLTGPGVFTPQAITQRESVYDTAIEAGSTRVQGHSCTKYEIPIPSSSLSKVLEKEFGSSGSGVGAAMVKSLLKDIHLSQTIAVDDSSHLMRQVNINVSMSIFGQSLMEKITMVLDHFGETVNIEVPASATPADKLPSVF
jgi:hypothetical protein